MSSSPFQGQIHQKPGDLIIAVSVIVLAGIIVIISVDRPLFPIILLTIVGAYGVFSFLNDRLLYNDSGITIVNSLNRKFYISWDCVVSIENTLQSPWFSYGKLDRILKIRYMVNNKAETIKYSYSLYTGLSEFYAFYATCIRPEQE